MAVPVAVAVPVGVGVSVGVLVAVGVSVGVAVPVAVGVAVSVGVAVLVAVLVEVGVLVADPCTLKLSVFVQPPGKSDLPLSETLYSPFGESPNGASGIVKMAGSVRVNER